jgi:hypothetical protein
MTASFDVEDVLSKLNIVEKVSLLAGTLTPPSQTILANNTKVLTGGTPLLFLNMAFQQFVSLMGPMESVEPDSSMELLLHAFLVEQLSVQPGISNCFEKQVLSWVRRARQRGLT